MLRLAAEVRGSRLLGWFDWLIFAQAFQKRVRVIIGSHVYDVCDLFGQGIDGAKWLGATADDTIIVCACVFDSSGESLTGASDGDVVPTINHFVIAIPVPGVDFAPPMHKFRATARGLSARAAALKAGYVRHPGHSRRWGVRA